MNAVPADLPPLLRHIRYLLAASLLASSLAGGLAQQKATTAPADTPSSPAAAPTAGAALVELPVVVRDKKGGLVQTLTKEDFTLQVDGKPQTIRSFAKDNDLPISVGLVIDSSLTQSNAIDEERRASGTFLDQILATAKDKGFVAQFSRQTELLQDITPSHPLLQAALKDVDTAPPADSDASAKDTGSRRSGTALYDAVFLTSDEIMSRQKGRKVVVLLSDGVDSGSKETLARAIETAQRANTMIFAIYLKGEETHPMNGNPRRSAGGYPGGGYPGGGYPGGGYPGGGYPGGGYPGGGYPGGGYPGGGYPGGGAPGGGNSPTAGTTGRSHIDGRKVLERIAHETGGEVFDLKKKQDMTQVYNQIADALKAQFLLGFTPGTESAGSGYHQVDLTTEQKGLSVLTRDGYYTGK